MSPPKKPSRPSSASLRRAFKEIIWPRRKLLFVGLVLILFNRLSGLVLPASTKYLIDDVIRGGQADLFWLIIGGVAVAVTIQAATSFSLTRLLSVEAQHLIAQRHSPLMRIIARLWSISGGDFYVRITVLSVIAGHYWMWELQLFMASLGLLWILVLVWLSSWFVRRASEAVGAELILEDRAEGGAAARISLPAVPVEAEATTSG